VNDLNESVILGAIGVVIHMGHNTTRLKITNEQAINNYIKGIKTVLAKSDKESTIIFETGAGQGDEICTSLFDLAKLRNKFTEIEKERIKFCIDTCHIYSAGYDVGNPYYVKMLENLIGTLLGWNNVIAIHLNDSECSLNCRKDRHADIGKGRIDMDGLMEFIKICINKKIPMFLETPCSLLSSTKQIQLIKDKLSHN